ncbi:MAG TPA: AI-2E family transporter [Xanthobacteraceae bacterium]|jgi:predicted PurR-regulated permease PerM
MPLNSQSMARLNAAAYVLTAVLLCLVLALHLLPTLFAGLLVYSLVTALAPALQRHIPGVHAHWLVVALLAILVVGFFALAIAAAVGFLHSENGNPTVFFGRLTPLLERAHAQLPQFIVDRLPDDSADMRTAVMDWLGEHTAQLQVAGKQAVRVVVQLIIGIVLGAMLALHGARDRPPGGPLSVALNARAAHLVHAFRDVVFAQVKISALNTLFTGAFLLIGLPLFGISLPLAKTLVALTFVVGLLPVIGNLISNTFIFIVALSHSLFVALAALAFLIVIHKLEYFLSARLLGMRIQAFAWELLIAMLLMEAAFGTAGLIAAPIYYAYAKRELRDADLI